MTGGEYTYHAEFRSGTRAELRLRMPSAGERLLEITCVWTPQPPDMSRRQGRRMLETYRAWRDDCLAEFAAAHGMRIVQMPEDPDVLALCDAELAEAISNTGGKSA